MTPNARPSNAGLSRRRETSPTVVISELFALWSDWDGYRGLVDGKKRLSSTAAIAGLATFALFLLNASRVDAVANSKLLGTDFTILTHNDLYGNGSPRQAATIVLSARQTNVKSEADCYELSESLWVPGNNTNFGFLRFLDYENVCDDVGIYWIGGHSASGCRAITTLGKIEPQSCDTTLSALCSQSALLSSAEASDPSGKWQVAVSTSDNATVIGYRDKLSFRFLGIQFASIPARFSYSTYKAPSGKLTALEYGAGCFQPFRCDSGPMTCNEECLFLNVWTPALPAKSSSKKKAVMLWIHGGAFTSGFGSETAYDGGNMASRGDVLVITINYRLSTLGFLALENTTLKGNYWLSDQIAALEWVQAHIEDFGGDKDRVTVFGQSAGAASVRALLASPLAQGKFSRAVMQSGSGQKYPSIPEVTNRTEAIIDETGCARADKSAALACLRALDPRVLIGLRNGASMGTVASSPVVDGTYLTSDELLLDGTGSASNAAILTGVVRDDGSPMIPFPKSSNVSQALTEQGYDAAKILDSGLFPVPHTSNTTLDIFNLTSRVTTDAGFRLYAYEMDRSYQITEWSPNPPTCEAPISADHPYGDPTLPYFRCHSGDIYPVFGTIIRQDRYPQDEDDIPLSQYLLDSWTAFGRTRDPNPALDFLQARGFTNTSAAVEQTGKWEQMQGGGPKLRVLSEKPATEGFKEVRQCEVLGVPLDYYVK
ncbi:alpha/beta-hydrolase [Byssothecium circinans]|uniref:Alpha/beta-hydrolase n=1 Tax=Byssothecium circinans TaxID=147558 RepID=A0A6A5TDJ9_9PLEO|nr:alpha/beta-hydrolase [Byssothecium circinans]